MRFVVLGDLHYSSYHKDANINLQEEFFDRLFRTVAQQQPDAVFAIGDTTDNGLVEEFEGLHQCAKRNRVDIITVNGNHDVLAISKQKLGIYTGNRFPYFALHFNPVSGSSTVTDPLAARFLVLDTPKEFSPDDHSGFVGPEQLAWLENQIIESRAQPLFAFGHHPLAHTTRWANFRMLSIENSKAVWKAFSHKEQGSAFYFCGHNHANSIVRRGNWHFIQSAAPLRTSDFRVIDFTPEEIQLQTVAIEGGATTNIIGHRLAKSLGDFKNMPSKGWRHDRQFRVKHNFLPPEPSFPMEEIECH